MSLHTLSSSLETTAISWFVLFYLPSFVFDGFSLIVTSIHYLQHSLCLGCHWVMNFYITVLYISVLLVYPKLLFLKYPPYYSDISYLFHYQVLNHNWILCGIIIFHFSVFLTKLWQVILLLFIDFSFIMTNDNIIFNIHIIFLYVFSY